MLEMSAWTENQHDAVDEFFKNLLTDSLPTDVFDDHFVIDSDFLLQISPEKLPHSDNFDDDLNIDNFLLDLPVSKTNDFAVKTNADPPSLEFFPEAETFDDVYQNPLTVKVKSDIIGNHLTSPATKGYQYYHSDKFSRSDHNYCRKPEQSNGSPLKKRRNTRKFDYTSDLDEMPPLSNSFSDNAEAVEIEVCDDIICIEDEFLPYDWHKHDSNADYDFRVVHVGLLKNNVTRRYLMERFKKFGRILNISFNLNADGLRYAFINFENAKSALNAIKYGNDGYTEADYLELNPGKRRTSRKRPYVDLDSVTSPAMYEYSFEKQSVKNYSVAVEKLIDCFDDNNKF